MPLISNLTLLVNGITLALSLGFLLIVLWQDVRKEIHQFFALFLICVLLWNTGSFLSLASALLAGSIQGVLPRLAGGLVIVGFTGSSVSVYGLVALLTGVHSRRFRYITLVGLLLIVVYQCLLIVVVPASTPNPQTTPATAYYLIFTSSALYLIWHHRNKLTSNTLKTGLLLFISGQTIALVNPNLGIQSLGTSLSAFGTLLISFAILRQQIIAPLAEQISQIESLHKVSLAIASRLNINEVLQQIALQAASWLNADAAGIFLRSNNELELVAVHNLPSFMIHTKVPIERGLVGKAVQTKRAVLVENYNRDWKGEADTVLAQETFGSAITVPLIHSNQTIGALLVVASKRGRLFKSQDVTSLELLGAQAAVALAHSRLFEQQKELVHQVESARSQLQSVLSSAENPIVAVDRQLMIIFSNPAAQALLVQYEASTADPDRQRVPLQLLPPDIRTAIRDLSQTRAHIYEINMKDRTFLCHVAPIGSRQRAYGWVAVLNDVSQLKEVDRLKSEMIRLASHDLKNPLQGAMANLELLSEDLQDTLQPEIQTSLEAIGRQLARMNRIINGILDLERAKTGTKLVMDLCSPSDLIENTIDEMQALANEKGILLTHTWNTGTSMILANGEQLGRALSNLVENAIKFTSPGGEVQVRAYQEQSEVIFEVSDNGIGIPEHLKPFVFDRFWRGSLRGQKGAEAVPGSGLGLSLVKAIVENHKGDISFESEEGCGTIFRVSLRSVKPSESSSQGNSVPRRTLSVKEQGDES